MTRERRVVVTGLGLATALGLDVEESFARALAGRSGITSLADHGFASAPVRAAGVVARDDLETIRRRFPEEAAAPVERRTLFALWAASEALRQAGVDTGGDRTGVVLGAGLGIVRLEDLAEPPSAPRLLLKTGTFGSRERFDDSFAGLDPSLASELAARGVVLVGIDTPSVDPYDDHAYAAHRALVLAGVAWLEGLVLAHVPPGLYELSALPLRIEGGDGSPVRAVLVSP